MSRSTLYLGVDGGGTKTDFVCVNDAGEVLARVTTGTCYHLQIGLEAAAAVLQEGMDTLCCRLGAAPDRFAFAFFGLPAYGEDKNIDPQLAEACGRLLGHSRFACGNDMICGWAGSLGCADGINLVAGTGSIGYGEREGLAARVGGWGEVFSDEGSAYWIGIQGLNAFTRMSDGRLPSGPLHRRFVEALDLTEDLDLCARVMGESGMTRDQIAGLSTIVRDAADDGDEVALGILNKAADELVAMAVALRRALKFEPGQPALLSWSGGILTKNERVRMALHGRLDGSDFKVIEPRFDPGVGAALYAAQVDRRSKKDGVSD